MNPLTQFKRILILPLLIALALVALASPQLVRADAVTDWNLIAILDISTVDVGALADAVVFGPTTTSETNIKRR